MPADWKQVDSSDTAAYFASADTLLACTVSAEAAPAGATLDLLDQIADQRLQQQPGYAAVKKDRVVVQGQNAYRRIYTVTLTASGRTEQVETEAVFYLFKGTIATITCATFVQSFAAAAPTFDGIAGATKLAGMAHTPAVPLAAQRRD